MKRKVFFQVSRDLIFGCKCTKTWMVECLCVSVSQRGLRDEHFMRRSMSTAKELNLLNTLNFVRLFDFGISSQRANMSSVFVRYILLFDFNDMLMSRPASIVLQPLNPHTLLPESIATDRRHQLPTREIVHRAIVEQLAG